MSDGLLDVDAPLRCRMAACRENLGDGQSWSFYLINDNGAALDLVVLYEIGSEWGDIGCAHSADTRVTNLAAGASTLLWTTANCARNCPCSHKCMVACCA